MFIFSHDFMTTRGYGNFFGCSNGDGWGLAEGEEDGDSYGIALGFGDGVGNGNSDGGKFRVSVGHCTGSGNKSLFHLRLLHRR